MPSFERWKKKEDIVKKRSASLECLSRERQNHIRGGGGNVKGVHLHKEGEDNMKGGVEGR